MACCGIKEFTSSSALGACIHRFVKSKIYDVTAYLFFEHKINLGLNPVLLTNRYMYRLMVIDLYYVELLTPRVIIV